MRATRRASLLLLVAVAARLAGAEPARDHHFVRLLRDSGWGMLPTEEAAWLVAGPDGTERFVRWPPATRRRGHTWTRPIPRGTVALLHTHPGDSDPRPSALDLATAWRFRLPVFTVSRWAIYRADPDGRVAAVPSPYWSPTFDPVLARRLVAGDPGRDLTGGGSSGARIPQQEPAVR